MTFQLDTSGDVMLVPGFIWSDLDPFTQGYVEALIQSLGECIVHWRGPEEPTERYYAGFRHLAPEALAMILRDCESFLATKAPGWPQRENGPHFWELRQAGKLPSFPPLTETLGGDGRVYLREA